jgi:hypothetical protein
MKSLQLWTLELGHLEPNVEVKIAVSQTDPVVLASLFGFRNDTKALDDARPESLLIQGLFQDCGMVDHISTHVVELEAERQASHKVVHL